MSAINVRDLAPGTSVVLADGAEAEIVTNPGDGMWLSRAICPRRATRRSLGRKK